ncbi:UNVERIFIED_CONTAM: hypothetical protein PYX00_005453 [Menopon gallinae]|uniref:DUF5641 domain-containing protein n=1 Tax=Menopon gallinae TaxID=328185 RepID=A0AAW2HRP2_9NEOP
MRNYIYISEDEGEKEVLLPTVDISIEDDNGKVHRLRALLDSGSQFNLIPGEVAKKLQMRQKSSSIDISTAAGNFRLPNSVDLKISTPVYKKTAECYVVEKLHVALPSSRIATSEWKHIEGLELADKQFYEPRKVDLILGVGICSELMADGLIRGTPDQPIAQKTILGWAISGNTGQRSNAPSYALYNAAEIIKKRRKLKRREIRGNLHFKRRAQESWRHRTSPLSVGDMVVLKDTDIPPLQWKLGRIIINTINETHRSMLYIHSNQQPEGITHTHHDTHNA